MQNHQLIRKTKRIRGVKRESASNSSHGLHCYFKKELHVSNLFKGLLKNWAFRALKMPTKNSVHRGFLGKGGHSQGYYGGFLVKY